MRSIWMTGLILGLSLLAVPDSMAASATCDEAQALLAKAIETFKADGSEKAFAKFQDPKGGFVDRDLYVFAFDKNGIFLEHAVKPSLVGKDSKPLKDSDGKPFMQEMLAIKGKGSIDYRWSDPTDNKVKAKTSYVEWVGDTLIGVGCYKE